MNTIHTLFYPLYTLFRVILLSFPLFVKPEVLRKMRFPQNLTGIQNGGIMVSIKELTGETLMLTLTIKNIPPQLYERLKISAQIHRRSINSEVLTCLEETLRSRRVDPETFLSRLNALHREISLPFLTDEALQKMKVEGRK
jgi:plasmid stability protein